MRAALIAVAIAIAPARAGAESKSASQLVGAASEAMAAIRYDEAARLLDEAWRRGESSPAELRRLFALAGRAAGSIGDDAAARTWFARWLSLEPDAVLPPGTSPKIVALFDQARASLNNERLAATAQIDGDRLHVTVSGDPAALARSVRAGAEVSPLQDSSAEVANGTPVVLLDAYGNVLLTIEPITRAPPPPDRVAISHPWYARTTTWAIATGALAATGGGALYIAIDARSDLRSITAASNAHEFSDTISPTQRLDRAQLVARVAFAASAATALVSVGLAIHWHRHGAVAVTPTAGGAEASWSIDF